MQGNCGDSSFAFNNVWGNLPGNYVRRDPNTHELTYDGSADRTGLGNNMSQDPLFQDSYHISANSPCCDAGDPGYVAYPWQRDIDGEYAVMGAQVDIGADEVTANARPVADAGQDRYFDTIVANVTLDGTSSYDPDAGDIISYRWRQVSGPNVILLNPDTAKPNFAPAIEDVYVFELTVTDGKNNSAPDSVIIVVGNRAPVADAGDNQVCEPGQQVMLDGSKSHDPDKDDVLSYSWSQISGPSVDLLEPYTQSPRFTPQIEGEYVFELVVNDGTDLSLPDTVTVTCRIGSEPDAYGYRWIDSDSAWGPKYRWIDIQDTGTKINGLDYSFDECVGPFPLGFDFNFYGNTYNRFYVQSNGLISFGADAITHQNQPIPATDGYDNIIAWMWTYMFPSNVSKVYYQQFRIYTVVQFVDYAIGFSGSVNAEVVIYKSGRIVIQYKDFSDDAYLRIYTIGIENADGTIGTQVAFNDRRYLHNELTIQFTPGPPYEPVADAGPDQHVDRPALITLDGSGSCIFEPNGVMTFQWTHIGGPSVELSDNTAMQPTFMPGSEGEYRFELVVSDGTNTSKPDEVLIVIRNRPPVADAGPDRSVIFTTPMVILNGSGSYDPAGEALTYRWRQIAGPSVKLSDPNVMEPTFVPSEIGIYVFELVVNDGLADSVPDEVRIVVGSDYIPVADAGLPVYTAGEPVVLDGTNSYDPDNSGPLSYKWRQISGPPSVFLGRWDSRTAKPTIVGFTQTDMIQRCKFELVVSDDQYNSLPDTVEVIIVPFLGENTIRLESSFFDPNKPTVIYFSGGNCIEGKGRWDGPAWQEKANIISFSYYGPDNSTGPWTYKRCGDALIVYLSKLAPNYSQPIQTMGSSTGGQPAIDVANYLNYTYHDARYAVNRVTLLDARCRNYASNIADYIESSVDGEQCWIDKYEGTGPFFYPGCLNAQVAQDQHNAPRQWYRSSLRNPYMNRFNGGVIAGAYWSVVGPGKNLQLALTPDREIYKFRWNGGYDESSIGYIDFFDEISYPGKLLEPVTLIGPVDIGDPNGAVLTCLESENAVGYQLLFGSGPYQVMDYNIIFDTPTPPNEVITTLPFEKTWWTVRAYDQYGSTIYADPKFINAFILSLPVENLTIGKRYSYIQDAIDEANPGDQIVARPGIYHENIDLRGKNLVISSIDPNDPIVVAATVINDSNQAVTFSSGENVSCMLAGFTITGAKIGLYCSDASPTINKCTIAANEGAGIKLWNSSNPTITNCIIAGNKAAGIEMWAEQAGQRFVKYNYATITNWCVTIYCGGYATFCLWAAQYACQRPLERTDAKAINASA